MMEARPTSPAAGVPRGRRILRRALTILALAAGGLLLLGGSAYGWSVYTVDDRLARTWDVAVPAIEIPSDPAAIARGEHLARHVAGCVACHGEDFGGFVFIDNPAIGRVMSANLTTGRGGVAGDRTDQDLVRAILHGVRPDGRSLRVMPTADYTQLSPRDLGALIAFLRTLPPVDRETSMQLSPLSYVLAARGAFPLVSAETAPHDFRLPPPVEPARTVEYGHYLARFCTGCHGARWEGRPEMPEAPPGTPPIPSLRRPGLQGWTEADFERAVRHGRKPGDVALHPFMPYRVYAGMTDDEVAAIWMFLQTQE